MYCTDWRKGDGFVRQEEGDLWVHSTCGLPTRQVLDKVTNMRAPKNTRHVASVHGHEDGTRTVTFYLTDGTLKPCLFYQPYPAKVDMTQPRDLLIEFWKGLDGMIDEIKTLDPSDETRRRREIEASMLARVIAKIMAPFYEDQTAVLREAQQRWLNRHNTDYESPGLAESIWDPQTRFDGTPYSEENEKRVRSGRNSAAVSPRPVRTGNTIPEQAIPTVKQALDTKMFTLAQVAKTYNMTEVEVKEQLGLV